MVTGQTLHAIVAAHYSTREGEEAPISVTARLAGRSALYRRNICSI
jgi:hypothetical protein